MNLAISNIGWKREDDAAVAALMRDAGIAGVEVAPTAVWPEPLLATPEQLRSYRTRWSDQGIQIVALQALLYGHPELTLFGAPERRAGMLRHLTGMMDVAAALGAGPLVFGSPTNRAVGDLPPGTINQIAVDFFRAAGVRAAERGVTLCLEPNPPAYKCDFVTTVADGLALVREVASAGFGLHVDAGALALNEEPIASTIGGAAWAMRHFHASEPFLAPLGSGTTNHEACAEALRASGYRGWVSLEMRQPPDGLEGVRRSLDLLRVRYGG